MRAWQPGTIHFFPEISILELSCCYQDRLWRKDWLYEIYIITLTGLIYKEKDYIDEESSLKQLNWNDTNTGISNHHAENEKEKNSGSPLYFLISITTHTQMLWFLHEVIIWDHIYGVVPEPLCSCLHWDKRVGSLTAIKLLKFYLAVTTEPKGPSCPNHSIWERLLGLWNQLYKSGMGILQRH